MPLDVQATPFDDHGSLIRWFEIDGVVPARVYIHGLGGTGEAIFGAVARDPTIAGHRSILVDLPGHGASDRPADYPYTLDAHAEAVVAACRAAGVDGIDVIGHSLGADIAIVIAARYPELVHRLVISEANLDPLPASLTGRGSQAICCQTEEAFVASGYRALLDGNESWALTLRFADARAIHRSAVGLTTGTTPTMRAMFVSMSIPRTFIKGDRGEPLIDEAGLEAAGVDVVAIPDAGHMMMFDNPGAFLSAVARGLART
jgi:pimeloyl-ACP methyl ester carboxylesterase